MGIRHPRTSYATCSSIDTSVTTQSGFLRVTAMSSVHGSCMCSSQYIDKCRHKESKHGSPYLPGHGQGYNTYSWDSLLPLSPSHSSFSSFPSILMGVECLLTTYSFGLICLFLLKDRNICRPSRSPQQQVRKVPGWMCL